MNANFDSLLIHIGYHKTSTSWLQNYLFVNKSFGFAQLVDRNFVFRTLVEVYSLAFNAHQIQQEYIKLLNQIDTNNYVPVISEERLSGFPDSGGYDSKLIADRLHAVFPSAKIFISIREQRAFLLSAYKQYIRGLGIASVKDYLFPRIQSVIRIPLFDFQFLLYHHLIAYYKNLFGDEHVLVLPYEMFVHDPHNYIKHILCFAGIKDIDMEKIDQLPFDHKVNKGASEFEILIRRYLNRWVAPKTDYNMQVRYPCRSLEVRLRTLIRRIDKYLPSNVSRNIRKKWQLQIDQAVTDFYSESNRITSNIINIDLGDYGYQMRKA